jgi:hypothetical protein
MSDGWQSSCSGKNERGTERGRGKGRKGGMEEEEGRREGRGRYGREREGRRVRILEIWTLIVKEIKKQSRADR